MIETIFLIGAVGLGCFLVGRISRSDREKAERSQASLRQPPKTLPRKKETDRPAEPLEPVPPAARAGAGAVSRELTPERRMALRDIHRQNALDRQHDSRMAAAAGLMGVAAGAALMHHHDAEQAHIDQAAAMQRDAALQQDHDSGADLSDFTDEYGVDFDKDWSIDDESDYDDDMDSHDDADYNDDGDSSRYAGDDASDYDGSDDYNDYDGSNYDAGQDDYSDYSDYSDSGDYGGDDGGGDDGFF